MRRTKNLDRFTLEQRWAVRSRDVQRAMLDIAPQIVHFSGHGLQEEGLVFEDETGKSRVVSTSALAELFELFSERVECVVLNACYSAPQAEAISQHIPYVIGTSQAVSDKAAIEFSVGFYDALAAGRSVEFAYKFGCAAMQLAGSDKNLTPILIKNSELKMDSSEQESAKTTKAKYQIVLSGSVDDLSEERIKAILKHLQSIAGDESLTIKEIKSGNIKLELEGSEEGFKVIEALCKEGKLTEVLGLRIKTVTYTDPSSNNRSDKVEIFFSYSHKDEDLRDELATHLSILERNGIISGWHDRLIEAGEEWENHIDERMNSARVVLLLVSSDFIASNYCWNVEVKRAMERHKEGEACVVPVILRPVNWRTAPFGKLQALPKDAKPVTTWSNRDEAFLNISKGIEAVVGRFK